MRKLLVALLLVAALAVGGYFGVTAYAQNEAERQVTALFGNLEAGGLKASRGPVRFDLFARTLDLADITLAAADGSGTTSIGRITARGFSPPANGRIKVARIEIADVAFNGPSPFYAGVTTGYGIPQIVIEDYEGPESVVASSSEPAQLLLSFLESASATAISAPSVLITTEAKLGDNTISTRFGYGAARLSGIAGGRIADVQIGPSTFSYKEPGAKPGNAVDGEIGRTTIKGMDIGAMIALGDPRRRAAETSFRTLYESIEGDDYKASFDNGFTQQWRKITFGKIAVRPAALPIDQISTSFQRLEEAEAKGERTSPAEVANLLDALAGLYGGIEFGGIVIDDMRLQQPGKMDTTLKALRVGDMAGGRFSLITLEGLSGKATDGKTLKLDRFALTGLNPGEMMQLTAEAASAPAALNTPQNALGAFRLMEGMEFAGLEMGADSTPGETMKVDSFQLSWGDYAGPMPQKIASSLRMSGPTAQFAEDQQAFAALADLGIKQLNLNFTGAIDFDEARKTMVATPFVAIGDAFSMSGRLALAGIDGSFYLAKDDAEALQNLLAVKFEGLEITLTDAGIYQMKLKRMAEDQGATPEATQEMVVGFAQIFAEQATSEHPELEPVSKAILDFLGGPKGTLTLKITPKGELPLATLLQATRGGDAEAALDLVNIEATTSR